MKKILLLGLIFIMFLSACKKDDNKSSAITNNGPTSVNVALRGNYQLNVTSDMSLSYYSDNTLYATVSNTGLVTGKNVGNNNIIVSNDRESISIPVSVDLFIQPTLDFTTSKAKIKSLYGEPNYNYGDTVYIYKTEGYGYSYSCWQMDFFFNHDGRYIESDVYIKNDFESLLNDYVNKNFHPYDTIIGNDSLTYYIFMNAPTEEASTVKMGKLLNANQWNDILLFYYPFNHNQKDDNSFTIKKSKVSCDGIRLQTF